MVLHHVWRRRPRLRRRKLPRPPAFRLVDCPELGDVTYAHQEPAGWRCDACGELGHPTAPGG